MDISTNFFIQVLLSFFLLFLWMLKPKTKKINKGEGKNVKKLGILELLQGNYMLFIAKSEIFSGRRMSPITKIYKKFLSPLSVYSQKPVLRKIFGMTVFIASDYETICQINKNDAFNDRCPDSIMELYGGGRPSGILFNNNKSGSGVLKAFVVKKFGQLGLKNKEKMTSILTEQLSELLERIEVLKLQGNNKIQANGLFSAAVINVIANSVFGKRFFQTDADFLHAQEMFNGLINIPFTSWVILYYLSKVKGIRDLFGYSRVINFRNNSRQILKGFIKERESLNMQTPGHEPENIIDYFLQEIDKQKNNESLNTVFTEEQHVTVLQDLMVAGMDTTSKFLESLLMYMCLYPEVQTKVQKEIDSVLGTSGLPRYYECKSSMNYTIATFWEVHRLTHEIAIVPRMTTKDVEIAGQHLPMGAVVYVNYLRIRMDETYWKKPFDFYPENFLDDNGVLIKEKVDRLLLFSSGARACPGEQISNAVSFTFGVGVLQRYTVRKGDDSEILGIADLPGIVNGPQPFHVSLFDR